MWKKKNREGGEESGKMKGVRERKRGRWGVGEEKENSREGAREMKSWEETY